MIENIFIPSMQFGVQTNILPLWWKKILVLIKLCLWCTSIIIITHMSDLSFVHRHCALGISFFYFLSQILLWKLDISENWDNSFNVKTKFLTLNWIETCIKILIRIYKITWTCVMETTVKKSVINRWITSNDCYLFFVSIPEE